MAGKDSVSASIIGVASQAPEYHLHPTPPCPPMWEFAGMCRVVWKSSESPWISGNVRESLVPFGKVRFSPGKSGSVRESPVQSRNVRESSVQSGSVQESLVQSRNVRESPGMSDFRRGSPQYRPSPGAGRRRTKFERNWRLQKENNLVPKVSKTYGFLHFCANEIERN